MTLLQKLVDIPYVFYHKHERAVLFGTFMLVAIIAGIGSYWWYRTDQQRQASFALIGSLEDFEKMISRPTKPSSEAITDLEQAFLAGSSLYASTSFAFFFEAFAAEMHILKGNHAEALTLLEKSLGKLSHTSPFYYLYATKVALLQIDSADKEVRDRGHVALKELSENQHNPQRDMALYYRGNAALLAGNRDEAITLWSSLTRGAEKSLPWAHLVESKLGY